jgi:predicted DNA-binding transcriptional regulator AlpA
MVKYIKDKEISAKLGGCSAMTIWRYRKEGLLPQPKKFNRQNYSDESEVDAAIESMLSGSKATA